MCAIVGVKSTTQAQISQTERPIWLQKTVGAAEKSRKEENATIQKRSLVNVKSEGDKLLEARLGYVRSSRQAPGRVYPFSYVFTTPTRKFSLF